MRSKHLEYFGMKLSELKKSLNELPQSMDNLHVLLKVKADALGNGFYLLAATGFIPDPKTQAIVLMDVETTTEQLANGNKPTQSRHGATRSGK
jgi:hypothetical protein